MGKRILDYTHTEKKRVTKSQRCGVLFRRIQLVPLAGRVTTITSAAREAAAERWHILQDVWRSFVLIHFSIGQNPRRKSENFGGGPTGSMPTSSGQTPGQSVRRRFRFGHMHDETAVESIEHTIEKLQVDDNFVSAQVRLPPVPVPPAQLGSESRFAIVALPVSRGVSVVNRGRRGSATRYWPLLL